MAEPEKEFLDDIDEAEAEELAGEMEEMDDAAIELDTLRAERDALQDKFMRALAERSPGLRYAQWGHPSAGARARAQQITVEEIRRKRASGQPLTPF